VLMLHLEARLDGLVSPIVLCLPYRSVEDVVNKLEHRHFEGQKLDPADASKVRAAVSGVDVELRVEAGAVDLKVSEVLELAVGDVIRLRRPADKGMVVYAGDVPTYVGTPGRNGNARAIQIRGAWERGR
jgi:flagellar motor switch protein FliM